MKKLCLLLALVASTLLTVAQDVTVSGKVTNPSTGKGIEGISVQVKGTNRGTSTNADGAYTISAPASSTLVFSGVGFSSLETAVNGQSTLDVSLLESANELNTVVVTALGIERKSKTLTYSTQGVKNSDLTTVKDLNPLNSLNGKVAGLQINRSASGPGGSARVVLRGQKSTRENQPLYVIDGVPIANSAGNQPGDVWGQSNGAGSAGGDGGDILSTINPEDIESINVLKGASAAALYGSQAQNGVIMITTKKGRVGAARVDFSSSFTTDNAMYKPELQWDYLQSGAGDKYSWGSKGASTNHVDDFYRTGTTFINSLALTAGNDKAQTYFSYSNTGNKGIIPTSEFDQHTFNFRETAKFLNDKLTVDGNVLFSTQKAKNRPPAGGLYFNPLTGLYLFPRGLNFNDYKENYEYLSPSRNIYLQNWWNINADQGMVGDDNQQNPYWTLNRDPNTNKKDNLFASVNLKYALTDWLTVQARGNVNRSYNTYELKGFAGTQAVLAGSNGDNGRYTRNETVNSLYYGDLILTGSHKLGEDFGLSFNAGGSINDSRSDTKSFDSYGAGLILANFFSLTNITLAPGFGLSQTGTRRQVQSVFGSTTFDWQEKIYLDLTARNDWSSTLAYTPEVKGGYFYYSAGANAIISDIVKLPDFFSFAKIRGSFARVGNDVAPFATLPTNTLANNNLQSINIGPVIAGATLRPEKTDAVELGAELRFIRNKLGLDFTWYKNNTKDQFFEFGAPRGSGFSKYYINAGNVQNSGIEAILSYDAIKTRNFSWHTAVNFTHNENKVVELAPQLGGEYFITDGGVNNYGLKMRQGGSFGDIYGMMFLRDKSGRIVVDSDGKPQKDKMGFVGNSTPKFMLGWNNNFAIGGFNISFLIDGRFGGKVMSITQAVLDEYGASQVSADARDNGGVKIDAALADGTAYTSTIPAKDFYTTVGGRAGITEYYMYDATNVRLRQFSVGYSIPSKLTWVKDIKLSLVGRNLFFFHKDAPYDPELSMSTANGLQGIDVFATPATRSLGLSLRCSF